MITTYNRRERLAEVLAPLLDDPEALEIVVVVDGSIDGSLDLLLEMARANPRLRPVAPEKNLGQARARIFGVQQARGEVVLSLDDDVVAGAGLVGLHRAHHAEGDHRLVVGYMPIELPDSPGPGQFMVRAYAAAYERECDRYEREPDRILTHLWAGNFSLRRDDFLTVVSEPDFVPVPYHDDRDLGLRLRRRGVKPVFDRRLRAEHRPVHTFESYLRSARSSGAGATMLAELHPNVETMTPDRAFVSYSWPAKVVVRASDRPGLRGLSTVGLRVTLAIAGRLRAYSLEERLGVVAGHIAEREGARSVSASGGGTGAFPERDAEPEPPSGAQKA